MYDVIDVDECISMTHNCDENAECINTEGSFCCHCNQGYIGNGKTCLQFSKPIYRSRYDNIINPCCFIDDASCPQLCGQHCINNIDSNMEPICACDHGYYLDADNYTCRGDHVVRQSTIPVNYMYIYTGIIM